MHNLLDSAQLVYQAVWLIANFERCLHGTCEERLSWNSVALVYHQWFWLEENVEPMLLASPHYCNAQSVRAGGYSRSIFCWLIILNFATVQSWFTFTVLTKLIHLLCSTMFSHSPLSDRSCCLLWEQFFTTFLVSQCSMQCSHPSI